MNLNLLLRSAALLAESLSSLFFLVDSVALFVVNDTPGGWMRTNQ